MSIHFLYIALILLIAQMRLDIYILKKKGDKSLENTSIVISMAGGYLGYVLAMQDKTELLFPFIDTIGAVILFYFFLIRTWAFMYIKSRINK